MARMTGRHEFAAASVFKGFAPDLAAEFAIDEAFDAPDDAAFLAHEAGGRRVRGAAPGEAPSTDYLLLF